MQKSNWFVPAAIAALVVACLTCFAVVGLVQNGVLTPGYTVVVVENVPATAAAQVFTTEPTPVPATPRPTEEAAPILTPDHWVGDDFGPEQAFPAKIVGPAIAEVKGSNGYCALVMVNSGESLNYQGGGAWWQAFSQAALEARFPHHEAEYSAKWPKCSIFEHAYDVK